MSHQSIKDTDISYAVLESSGAEWLVEFRWKFISKLSFFKNWTEIQF